MSSSVQIGYPAQLEDVMALKAAIKLFSKTMTAMMLLIKELGSSLERVGVCFDALTSMRSSDEHVRRQVHSFLNEITRMKEGVAFQSYNARVHEEVMKPVADLRTFIEAAEKAASKRDKSCQKYSDAAKKVHSLEEDCVAKGRPIESSHSYTDLRKSREKRLVEFRSHDNEFQKIFSATMRRSGEVTLDMMKRYLHLNGQYLSTVVRTLNQVDSTTQIASPSALTAT